MSAEEVSRNVETIEVEAEKMLEDARIRASEILLKAKEEAGQILSAELAMDEVKAECEKIIHRARDGAEKEAQDSEEKAALIRNDIAEKVEGIVQRLVGIITGENP